MKSIKNTEFSFHVEHQTIKNIKYFVFKEKKYPIDFDLLKKNSQYFYRNRKQFSNVSTIMLLNSTDESLIDFSEETIKAFIASCSNDPCKISFSDVIPLQYLSYKFEFPGLNQTLDNFIDVHSDELVFSSIMFKFKLHPNNKEQYKIPDFFYDTKKEEDIITANFIKYIEYEEMVLLPIPVLDRIFNHFFNFQQNEENNSPKIIKFLFKCLDKHGIDASILFSYVDFQDQSSNIAKELIQNYSDKFDFNMINSTLLKSTQQLTSELSKVKEENLVIFSDLEKKIQ